MGDFVLSIGAATDDALARSADFLRFCPDMRVNRLDQPEFCLVLTSPDNLELWGPYTSPDGALLVALAGRIALDQTQWAAAATVAGQGGLACKYISQQYVSGGIGAVESLSGNFVIVVYDRLARSLFLVTDRWGLFPAFRYQATAGRLAFASHPDALADAVGESRNWDLTSFAEFILTGKLSAPFTYYRKIQALPVGSTTTIGLRLDGPREERTRTYFEFRPQPQPIGRIDELAEEFVGAFRQAVAKRTLPLLGKSAVALSGGLDSRTILCAAPDCQALVTFSCYDEENLEFRIAKSIAHSAGVEFLPLKRDFDYYGNHAALGSRISGGMGCIASNHFLGFRDELRRLGIENLLTGCYCDYLFKGLAYNKRVNRWTTLERLGEYDPSYYFKHLESDTVLASNVRERLQSLFPDELRRYDSPAAIYGVEQRRMFPLAYEEDNAERVLPQRVMGWYIPIAENALMAITQKMGWEMKLNRRLFAMAVRKICGGTVSRIPDANTGVPVSASLFREACSAHLRDARRLLAKLKPSNATNGSWVNWGHYARKSTVVQSLWDSPNPDADAVFEQVLGKKGYRRNLADYDGRQLSLFLQLFTLKLWLDQRPR